MQKTLYSATKPTGRLTLGNYIGAIKLWRQLQEDYNCYFCVADLHSLTINMDPQELQDNIYSQIATFIAFGLDPKKSVIYVQSQVVQHAELAWIMNCNTNFGEASRMTQYKDAAAKNKNVSVGLFTYPMLMAADILLYDSHLVPVGKDQVQHVEIARDICLRFNNKYGKTFEVPDYLIPKSGAKIMGLLDPSKKMAKSGDNENDVIFIEDEDEVIRKKFKRAVTDSENLIKYSPEKPGVSNLLTIYSAMKDITVAEAEKHFEGKMYGHLKAETAEAVIEVLSPVRKKLIELRNNKEYLQQVMRDGASRATAVAKKKVQEVYNKVGLVTI